MHAHDGHHLAVLGRRLDVDDALTAAALHTILVDAGAFAITFFGYRKHHVRFARRRDGADDIVALFKPDADDAVGLTAHLADFLRMRESDALPIVRSDKNRFIAGNQLGGDQFVFVRHAHGDDPAAGWIAEIVQRGLLHLAIPRRHQHKDFRIKFLD